MEKGIVARDCLPPEPCCPLPRHRRLGSGQRGSGRGQSRATIPFPSMSRFMYFRDSKPKFLTPNSFSTMQQNGYPKNSIQHLRYSVYSHTHTHSHVVLARSQLIGGPNYQRGGNMLQIGTSELCFVKGRAGYLVLVSHLTPFLATGGP